MVDFLITLTDEQRQRAEARAQALGYDSPDEYLQAVLEQALENTDTQEEILASIERSLIQIQQGKVMSVDEMWQRLESDEDG
jgi:predicted transcriptional regulator